MQNLDRSWVKASDMVPQLDVGPISPYYALQFFFLILV